MAFSEKPPILTGEAKKDIAAIRDYLFRFASTLDEPAISDTSGVQITTKSDGTKVLKPGSADPDAIAAIRKNAQELKSLIIKSANNLQSGLNTEIINRQAGDAAESAARISDDNTLRAYCDAKVEQYDGRYVAASEFGTFQEDILTTIETSAMGVVESYGYSSSINSLQTAIDLLQSYYTALDGEIRRGIVLDPTTGEYVTGIAISQNLTFSGECGPSDVNNPGDGYVYYYLSTGQTFGLYTSTGWQFWIDGYKKGWFDSTDGMLHVANIVVEDSLQIGGHWQLRSDSNELEIVYVAT